MATDAINENKLDLKFLYFESMKGDDAEQPLVFLNSTYSNKKIQTHLKIPAHHSMTILLTVRNIQDMKTNNIDLISSMLYEHEFVIATKYQVNLNHNQLFKILS